MGLSTWSAVFPAFAYKCYCDCFEPDTNEMWKQAGAREAELEAEQLEKTRERRQNASPEEIERQNTIAKGKTDVGDAGVNTAHAERGRVHVRHPEMGVAMATAKALSKFKGMINKFKKKPEQ